MKPVATLPAGVEITPLKGSSQAVLMAERNYFFLFLHVILRVICNVHAPKVSDEKSGRDLALLS